MPLFAVPWDIFLSAMVTPADWWCFKTGRLMNLLTMPSDNLADVGTAVAWIVYVLARLDERHFHEVFGVIPFHVQLHVVVGFGGELHANAGGTHLSIPAS